MELQEMAEKKRKLFKRVFGDKYWLRLLELKIWDNKDGRTLAEVSFVFGELMTALEIQTVCEKMAWWIGGDLLGTVNLDFSGTEPSLEMMVEVHNENHK